MSTEQLLNNERQYHQEQIKRSERAVKIAQLQTIGVVILSALPFLLFCAACYYISPFNN
jgi:hypothetical protein